MKFGRLAKWVLGVAAVCAAPWAHAATLTVASRDLANGTAEFDLPISLAVAGSEAIASAQFELRFPDPPLGVAEITAGETATAAGKSVVSNAIDGGHYRVIVAGLNQNHLADGALVRVSFTLAPEAKDTRLEVVLEGVVLADPTGRSVGATLKNGQITAGDPGAMPTPPPSACGCGKGGNVPLGGDGLLMIALIVALVLWRVSKTEN